MKPMLEQCRAETEKLVEEKNKKLLEKVWPDMVLVSNILGKMDRLEEEGIRSAVGTAGTGPVSLSPATAGGTGTGGQAQSPANMSAGQVQQQFVAAGETAQVTSPVIPMAVPPPAQQHQRSAIHSAGYLNNLLELVLQ